MDGEHENAGGIPVSGAEGANVGFRRFLYAGVLLTLSITGLRASSPVYLVGTAGHNSNAIKLMLEASAQVGKGDYVNARRNVDAALRTDRGFWPTLFVRAQIYVHEHKWALAIQDCNEALRNDRAFMEAAILRAQANAGLGRYAECLKELDHVVSIRPPWGSYANALNARAWFRATCPDAAFRNSRKAIDDAQTACKLTSWKDGNNIDALAAAYAAAGDFDSAIRYEEKAIATKTGNVRRYQQHLDVFRKHRPLRFD